MPKLYFHTEVTRIQLAHHTDENHNTAIIYAQTRYISSISKEKALRLIGVVIRLLKSNVSFHLRALAGRYGRSCDPP